MLNYAVHLKLIIFNKNISEMSTKIFECKALFFISRRAWNGAKSQSFAVSIHCPTPKRIVLTVRILENK